jgi:hypothetical protein
MAGIGAIDAAKMGPVGEVAPGRRDSMLKRLAFLVIYVAVIAFGLWQLPGSVWRHGGTVDMAVLVDTSGSTTSQLPAYRDAACELAGALQPGDRLAVIWFDAAVHQLYRGSVGASQVLDTVQSQIRSLSSSDADGTVLAEALAQAGTAFEAFTGQEPSSLARQKIMVLFSDGQSSPVPGTQAAPDWDKVQLPGLMTVLALGFEGVPEDRVVQTLLGPGGTAGARGTNDVHLMSMQDAKSAVNGALKLVRHAHPWNWSRITLAAVGLLLGGLCILGVGPLGSLFAPSRGRRPLPMQPVKVRAFGSDDEREAYLANGDAITLGRRQELPFPTDSVAIMTRENDTLRVTPQSRSDSIAVVRDGEEIPVTEPMVLRPGDLLQLDGLRLEVEFAASRA